MIPRMRVCPNISLRKNPLETSGSNKRTAATIHGAGGPKSKAAAWARRARVGWISAISAPRHQALRPNGQHEHHDEEGHDNRIGGDVNGAELLRQADDEGAERRAGDRPHAAEDDDDERIEQEARVLAR